MNAKEFELTDEQYKKLKSIERRIKKCSKDISEMGFTVYLNSNQLSIMNGPTHDDSRNQQALIENEIFSIPVSGWDGGDW